MIKIEITDPHLLDKKAIQETAKYLMALTGGQLVIPAERKVNVGDISEQAAEFKKIAENIANNIVRPPLSVDEQLDMQQIAGVAFDEPLIEEELIPVPPENMTLDDFERERESRPVVPHDEFVSPPSAAEIFNPVNGLKLPPVPKPSVELDTQGMPWDVRIHARTKTKMKDGSWKKLRGVGPDVVKRVEGELKAVQNIPAPPPSVAVPVPPVTATAVIPAAPAVAAVPGFTDLMALVTKSITEGTLKRDQVVEVLKPFGIPSLPLVSTRLDLIPAIMLALEGVINAPR